MFLSTQCLATELRILSHRAQKYGSNSPADCFVSEADYNCVVDSSIIHKVSFNKSYEAAKLSKVYLKDISVNIQIA